MSERRPSYEELLVENQELRAKVLRLEARIVELEELVQKLVGKLGLNSQNSSKPPSSDPPWMPKSQREKSEKTQGGQRGHKGESLKMVAEPDRVEYHCLEGFCSCGRDLGEAQLVGIARRQVVELPAIRAEVIEHQVEERMCKCGAIQQASFPEGVNT
jgi:transposase